MEGDGELGGYGRNGFGRRGGEGRLNEKTGGFQKGSGGK